MDAATPSPSRHELRHYVVTQGRVAIESRQVCQRMRKLLRDRLQQLISEYRQQHGRCATSRALTDPRYLDYVEQVVEVCGAAQAARIRHETHRMYYEVR